MSEVPPGYRTENGGGGSVRRAREMLEAGVRKELPGQSQYGDYVQSPIPSKSRRQPPKGIGITQISRPSPMAQWPLRDDTKPNSPNNSFTPRGPPPQRPRRPSHVLSILDSSKIQDITPNISYRPQDSPTSSPAETRQQSPRSENMDNFLSPTSDYRESGSDTLSDISEHTADPVFILPIQAPNASRRSGNLGPPPTSRRGPSSYYSRGPFVSPIPEELSDKSPRKTKSFGSSAAIPSSWGSGPPESDILGVYDNESLSGSEDDREWKEFNTNEEETTLVRQASLGKRGKPALRTINKPDLPPAEEVGIARTIDSEPAGLAPTHDRTDSSDSGLGYSTLNILEGSTSSDSDSDSFDMEKAPIILDDAPATSPTNRGFSEVEDVDAFATAAPAMSSRIPDSRRPPRLDIDAVREAEARGSLTSLPDLIRRATRVASNLERGKTASRFGILEMFNSSREFKVPADDPQQPQQQQQQQQQRTSGTLSDILASFPPPRNDTPNTEPQQRQQRNSWPFVPEKSQARDMQSRQDMRDSTSRRRCCGMSLRLFIFLCIVVMLLAAAAVIIPVVLIVLPRNRHTAPITTNATDVSPCQQILPCMNGGISIMNGNKCSCVCVDGFSGRQCTDSGDASCTTTQARSSIGSNATVGNSLPRLFSASETNFSIPLNETGILSLFNVNNLSCTTQNALVSFNGASAKRRRSPEPWPIEYAAFEPQTTQTPDATLLEMLDDPNDIATTNGILYQPDPTSTSTSLVSKTAEVSPMQMTTSPTPTSLATLAQKVFDFARVAVLFILDETDDLDAATTAQSRIASFLTGMSADYTSNKNMNLTGPEMPTNFVLNFANFTITLANGTVVGGGNSTG